MARRWTLDTETKGTGAHVVPLEDVVRTPEPRGKLYVPPKRRPKPLPPPRPRAAHLFKVVEVVTQRVLGEGLDARATVALLEGVRSTTDVRLYVWEPNLERWRMLTLGEQRALWNFRGRRRATRQEGFEPPTSASGGRRSIH